MDNLMGKTVVLAYSGGLDTSVMVRWLRERGAEVVTATGDLGGGVDAAALRKYFAYGYVPAPHAIHAGVEKLPAGCNLVFELSGEPRVSPYWAFVLEPQAAPPGGPDAWAEELRERLATAVLRRLAADVPVGLKGVDSP